MNDDKIRQLFVDDSIVAPYKIEIQFGTLRSVIKPNPVAITVWESGKKLNGEGDTLMVQCCRIKGGKGCGRFLSMDLAIYKDDPKKGRELAIICPYCGMASWTADLATEEYIVIGKKELAEKIVKIWHSLPESAADIYLKHSRTNIKRIHEIGGGMSEMWATDDYVIYPYVKLMEVVSMGADLTKQVEKFLAA